MRDFEIFVLCFFAVVLQVSSSYYDSEEGSEFDFLSPISNFVQEKFTGSAPTYRLPNNSIPMRYDLWLKTDIHRKKINFSARVKIHVKILEATSRITLNLKKLQVTKIDLLTIEKSLKASNLRFKYDETYEFIFISLPYKVSEGEEMILDIQYEGEMSKNLGIFYETYESESGVEVYYAATKFVPANARLALPCYDEPQLRAVINVRIQHDKRFNAVSNMPIVKREELINTDYVTSEFQDTPPMQTYLLGFFISDFKYISNGDVTVEQRIYAKPHSIDTGEADFVLSIVGLIKKKLENHFGVEFPVKKVDHIAINSYGNVECLGAAFYGERWLLHRSTSSYLATRQEVISYVAQTLTYHYFGNLIGLQWWSHLWLKQGLTKFYQIYLSNQIFPDEVFVEKLRLPYTFAGGSNTSLSEYIESPNEIQKKPYSFFFDKPTAIIRMFHKALTPETFAKGIKYFLNAKYLTSTPEDFYRELQKAYNEDFPENDVDIAGAMRSWADQGSYPVLTVETSGRKILLTQKKAGDFDGIFTIPIFYAQKSGQSFDKSVRKIWMKTKTIEIEVENDEDWIILNTDSSGFYEVEYSKDISLRIIATFQDNHKSIPPFHRVKLFKHFYNLLKEDSLPMSHVFKLFEYLQKENELGVWKIFGDFADYFKNHLFGTSAHKKYEMFIQQLIKPHLMKYGFDEVQGELKKLSDFRKLFVRLSCEYNDLQCLKIELENLKESLRTNKTSSALCNGFKIADEETYMAFLAKLSHPDPDYYIVQGLGCSFNKTLLKRLLETVLRRKKLSFVLSKIMRTSPEGLEVTLDFVGQNFDELKKM